MMENIENTEDIYFVEIKNNKRFKGVYVNKAVILEDEVVDEEVSSIKTEVDDIINEISNLNIDNKLKRYLLKSELRMFNLKSELYHINWKLNWYDHYIKKDFDALKKDFEQLKRDLLGTEDNIEEDIDVDEDINIDDLLK